MSTNTTSRSLKFSDSPDFSESWQEYNKSSRDSKSFMALVQQCELKINFEITLSIEFPKDFRKKLESFVFEFFRSLLNSNSAMNELQEEKFSPLIVFIFVITKRVNKEKKVSNQNDLIKHIKELFNKFDVALRDYIEPRSFKKFEYMLIVILKILIEKSDDKTKELICNCLCNLLDKVFNHHSIYWEYVVDDENTNKINSCFFDLLKVKNIAYLALNCLNHCFPHFKCKSIEIIKKTFGFICIHIERPGTDFQTYVIMYELILRILEVVLKFPYTKKNTMSDLLLSIENDLQSVLSWACCKFLLYNKDDPCDNFLTDSKPLGKLFKNLCILLNKQLDYETTKASHEIFENLLMKIFTKALNSIKTSNEFEANKINTLQIQAYILQIFAELYNVYRKRRPDEKKDTGLINLLLRNELFIIEFHDEFSFSL